MGRSILAIALGFVSLWAMVAGLEMERSFLVALDDTMLALEKDRATKSFTAEIVPILRPVQPKVKTTDVFERRTVSGIAPMIKSRRVSFGSRRRRYVARKRTGAKGPRPSVKRPVSKKTTPKKTRVPVNKNLQALNQIQNGMWEAAAMRHGLSPAVLRQQIKEACDAGEYIFARRMLGHNMYNLLKAGGVKRHRRATNSAGKILSEIEAEIGKARYDRLLAYYGGVTLAFAFDTTGSMSGEMDETKQLSKEIVFSDRLAQVDYALFPFNDPITHKYHGPIEHRMFAERDDFVKLINDLEATGGGDCKEMAINGIQNLFNAPIQMESPIYVFTDAGAKDATDENVEALKDLVGMYLTPINFFLSNRGCLTQDDIKLYQSLAESTGGQIIYFSSSSKSKLRSMTDFIQKALIGTSSIPIIPANRNKRAIGAADHTIQVDNSIETLSVTVMASSQSSDIRLYNPTGTLQLGKNTGKSTLYLLDKPASGNWKLSVPRASGNSFLTANCISYENIDFHYHFVLEAKVLRKNKKVLSKQPIKGKTAAVVITVPAYQKTQPSSFRLKIVNNAFHPSSTISLKKLGSRPGLYQGTFPTPSFEFKLILEGKTKENVPFQRLGKGIIKPKSVLIHVFSAPKGFALRRGSTTILMFGLHNSGLRDIFEVRSNELEKSISHLPRRVYGIPGRMSVFTLRFKVPRGAKKGQTHNVVVTVVGKSTGARASQALQFLIQ